MEEDLKRTRLHLKGLPRANPGEWTTFKLVLLMEVYGRWAFPSGDLSEYIMNNIIRFPEKS
jgi:hypothetical protein